MNRTALIVGIAAIAVVGIAVGLFLAGQNGQLAGALEPASTTLDLIVSNCSPVDARGYSSFTITGHLLTPGGVVENRTVNLVGVFPEQGLSAVEQFVTGRDGSFRVTRNVRPSANATGDNWQAFFYGDAQYGPSTSQKVYRPC